MTVVSSFFFSFFEDDFEGDSGWENGDTFLSKIVNIQTRWKCVEELEKIEKIYRDLFFAVLLNLER